MVCYIVPLGAAAAVYGIKRTLRQKAPTIGWLNMFLWGGAIMLVVDHLWNGELFLIGENIVSDLALGVVMTCVVVIVWSAITALAKIIAPKHAGITR